MYEYVRVAYAYSAKPGRQNDVSYHEKQKQKKHEMFTRNNSSLCDRFFIGNTRYYSLRIYNLTGHLVKAKDIGLFPPYGEVNEMLALSLIGLLEGRCLCDDLKRKEKNLN